MAPFIAINDRDSRAAWSFTLLHELAHVWLGQTGISGGAPDQAIERFCNDVASEYLLPKDELKTVDWRNVQELDELCEQAGDFARERNISRQLVAYRLYRQGLIGADVWSKVRERFRKEWMEDRQARREKAREKDGGPNFYVVKRHRVGTGLIDLVSRMMAGGVVTTSKAGKILGVRPTQVAELVYGTRAGGGSSFGDAG